MFSVDHHFEVACLLEWVRKGMVIQPLLCLTARRMAGIMDANHINYWKLINDLYGPGRHYPQYCHYLIDERGAVVFHQPDGED